MGIKLFLDDFRTPDLVYEGPDDWVLLTTPEAFEKAAREAHENKIDMIWSLDHDLGETINGYELLKKLHADGIEPKEIYFHTANPVGLNNMRMYAAMYMKNTVIR